MTAAGTRAGAAGRGRPKPRGAGAGGFADAPADWPRRKYSIVYADPPWDIQWAGGHKGPDRHYPLMRDDEILALPVPAIAADNCALFLWATMTRLPLGLAVLAAWGFRYATNAFCWVKRNRTTPGYRTGLGYYTRANAELCLLGVRGTMRPRSHAVHSVVDAPITRHSEKPACVRERIVSLFGDVPRVELFARQPAAGWDAWGNDPALRVRTCEGEKVRKGRRAWEGGDPRPNRRRSRSPRATRASAG